MKEIMDYYLFNIITNFWGRFLFLDYLFIFLGKYFGYILIILFILLFLKKKKDIFYNVFFSVILARFIIVPIIRFFYYKDRPFVVYDFVALIDKEAVNSFPSGHATFFFAFAVAIFLINKKIGTFFLISAFLISISRVYTGIHYPSDIFFGGIIGILSAVLIYKLNLVDLLKKQKEKNFL